MARYLRIAAGVFFALLAVALIGLWVLSYEWNDRRGGFTPSGRVYQFSSDRGRVSATLTHEVHWQQVATLGIGTIAPVNGSIPSDILEPLDKPRTCYVNNETSISVSLPNWSLVASFLALAALFAFKKSWRFTVRGLLIATTAVAAILGLAVYSIS